MLVYAYEETKNPLKHFVFQLSARPEIYFPIITWESREERKQSQLTMNTYLEICWRAIKNRVSLCKVAMSKYKIIPLVLSRSKRVARNPLKYVLTEETKFRLSE